MNCRRSRKRPIRERGENEVAALSGTPIKLSPVGYVCACEGSDLESFYRQYYPRIRNYACRAAGKEAGEDIAIESFENFIDMLGDGRICDRARAAGWVFNCVKKKVMAGRRKKQEVLIADVQDIQFEDMGYFTVEDSLDAKARLSRLNSKDRAALEFRYIHKMSDSEIGLALKLTTSAVRQRICRALRNLRTQHGL